jgi:hypothetical protein
MHDVMYQAVGSCDSGEDTLSSVILAFGVLIALWGLKMIVSTVRQTGWRGLRGRESSLFVGIGAMAVGVAAVVVAAVRRGSGCAG